MDDNDLHGAARVHSLAFVRQKQSYEWLASSLRAFPRFLPFVAEDNGEIVAYILWAQKSGFRDDSVVELDQVAVLPEYQGKGIGRMVIEMSLPFVRSQLESQGSQLKNIIVSTRADNYSQRLYASALGAKVEATISNLCPADEVFMVARNV